MSQLTEAEIREKQSDMLRQGRPLVERWNNMPVRKLERYGFSESTEGGKFLNFLEHIPKDRQWRRYVVATLLETAYNHCEKLHETIRMHQIGGYEKFLFPTIAAVYGNLVLDELVSVQPLTAPSGLIFYLDVLAGTTKGRVKKGSRLFTALSGPEATTHYADEVVEDEQIGTGDGATVTFPSTLSFIPVRPGTVVVTDGSVTLRDDGDGGLPSGGTINYATGAISAVFAVAPVSGAAITVSYEYDSELSDQVPQMDIRLVSSSVVARPDKLKTQWSIESAQDLMNLHGLDVEPTILGYSNNEIQREILNRVIRHITTSAGAGTVVFDRTPPAGVQYYFHKQQLRDVLTEGSGLIRSATRRFRANWLVCDVTMASVLRTLDGWQSSAVPTGVAGIYKIGTIDGLDVYEDPDFPVDTTVANIDGMGVLGHRGSTFIEAGYVFAPYMGVFTTETIVLPDFMARKGLLYRSARKLVDSGRYAIVQMLKT